MALRSSYELMTAIDIALGLDFLTRERSVPLLKEADEIAAMIVGLMKSLGWKSDTHKIWSDDLNLLVAAHRSSITFQHLATDY